MKISKKMFLVIDENMRLCLYIKLKICDERERERERERARERERGAVG